MKLVRKTQGFQGFSSLGLESGISEVEIERKYAHPSPPSSKSKSLLLMLPACKFISLQMSSRILIAEEIYSIKINKYLSVQASRRAALGKSPTTSLST